VPDVAAPTELSMLPVPFANTAVIVVLSP
jgi:hypothetical protein